MLRKRLIGVVTVRQGLVVQSMGYQKYLPVGDPACVVENLDRWGVDEIFIQVIDRTGFGPDFALLNILAHSGLSTPVCYCGGIRNEQDAIAVIQQGADRIAVDSLLHDDPDMARNISLRLGAQAVVAVMPVINKGNEITWYDYRNKIAAVISDDIKDLFSQKHISELMLIDSANEGKRNSFSRTITDAFEFLSTPMILFGGISEPAQHAELLADARVSATACGNFLNYKEHMVQQIKQALNGVSVRQSQFQSGDGLCL